MPCSWQRLLACLVACALCSCEMLIGLDERSYVQPITGPDGGPALSPEVNAACRSYCSDVIDACSNGNDTYVNTADYGSTQVCLAVCARLDASDPSLSGNTLACRRQAARLAKNTNAFEKGLYCPAAGPGGGTPGAARSCGSNCESYCSLYRDICDPELDEAACQRQCAGLRDEGAVNANQDFARFPDTVQCWLAHLSVAAFTDPKVHCQHARLIPDEGGVVSCDLSPGQKPDCADYCKLVDVACTGASRVYESTAQCMSVCSQMDPGMAKKSEGDTLACRRQRAYAALLDPASHCSSAGPLPAGPCGDPCDGYCSSLETTCPGDFMSQFNADTARCRATCRGLPAAGGFSLALSANPQSLQCRVLALSRAKAGDPGACPSAAGGGSCR